MDRRLPLLTVCVISTLVFAGTYKLRGSVRTPDTPRAPAAIGQPSTSLHAWEFDSERDLHFWQPNAHLRNVTVTEGVLHARAIDWDPFLLCRDVSIGATPNQYVAVRMRATRAGIGELFWSGQLTGQYGGLTEAKKLRFSVAGGNQWQEIVLFPFWHTERVIRQLRLDLYEGSDFEIDWIRIDQWGWNSPPSDSSAWYLGSDVSPWQVHASASELFAPSVELDVGDKTWVAVEVASDREGVASVLWACQDLPGLKTEEFPLRGDGKSHIYDIPMAGLAAWHGHIVAFGIRLPPEAKTRLNQVLIDSKPCGPGELEVNYFGFENGVNRAGRPCKLLAQVTNRGGSTQGIRDINLRVSPGLSIISQPEKLGHPGIDYGQVARYVWEVRAEKPGTYPVYLAFSGMGQLPPQQKSTLVFTEARAISRAAYVPAPQPVKTDIDICAFYFPGWESNAKWDCIRKTDPGRKPLLGYYDEANPECVDWQIKWAVENGISCFLVDWYWVQGRQQLTHWFDAYRRARYRDSLKVAIMWANHNPPGTHSVQDWRDVTGHWIDRYFSLPSYYRINGRPAVFIWNPQGIRNDLGGSEAVRKAFDEAQARTRQAGLGGITLVALGPDFSAGHLRALKEEGYFGVTTYHEWGAGIDGQVNRKLYSYEDVVRQSPEAWERKNKAADSLVYYPLVDTGWDSRPWHGYRAMVIQGRTPLLFEELLQRAKALCQKNGKGILILGPVNEWGEGSYIEPCAEFGFGMLEAVRRTFATGPSSAGPINISPADVSLGPYEFPSPQP